MDRPTQIVIGADNSHSASAGQTDSRTLPMADFPIFPRRPSPRRAGAGMAAFFRRAITDQATIGAVAPSSAALARCMARLIPPSPGLRVLELGAGTGAISTAIGPRLGPGARHFALERDPVLLAVLEHRAPWAVQVLGDAAELTKHLTALNVGELDVVISALPWSYFCPELQQRIMAQVCAALAPGGLFATVAYRTAPLHPRYRAFRALLDTSFEQVVGSATIWANMPPARVLTCRSPHARTEIAALVENPLQLPRTEPRTTVQGL